jgi:hypothetical protein
MAKNIFRKVSEKKPSDLRALSSVLEDEILKTFDESNKIVVDAEWFNYAVAYLKSATTLLEKFKEDPVKNELLFIPAMFNLRHGLEITLKTVYKLSDMNVDNLHDINELYKRIQDKINELHQKDLTKLVKKYAIDEKRMKKINKEVTEKFRILVVKYYYQIPISKFFSSESVLFQDTNNEIFRYPETNKLKVVFKLTNIKLSEKISGQDIDNMTKDIEDMLIFISLFYQLKNDK